MILLWLGVAKLFSAAAPAAVGGRASRDVPAGRPAFFLFFLRLCSVPSILRCGCHSLSHVDVQKVGFFGNPRYEEAQSRVI